MLRHDKRVFPAAVAQRDALAILQRVGAGWAVVPAAESGSGRSQLRYKKGGSARVVQLKLSLNWHNSDDAIFMQSRG